METKPTQPALTILQVRPEKWVNKKEGSKKVEQNQVVKRDGNGGIVAITQEDNKIKNGGAMNSEQNQLFSDNYERALKWAEFTSNVDGNWLPDNDIPFEIVHLAVEKFLAGDKELIHENHMQKYCKIRYLSYLERENNRKIIEKQIAESIESQSISAYIPLKDIQRFQQVIWNQVSERQYKIFNMHVKGYTNREIAKSLKVQRKTVYNAMKKIESILEVSDLKEYLDDRYAPGLQKEQKHLAKHTFESTAAMHDSIPSEIKSLNGAEYVPQEKVDINWNVQVPELIKHIGNRQIDKAGFHLDYIDQKDAELQEPEIIAEFNADYNGDYHFSGHIADNDERKHNHIKAIDASERPAIMRHWEVIEGSIDIYQELSEQTYDLS